MLADRPLLLAASAACLRLRGAPELVALVSSLVGPSRRWSVALALENAQPRLAWLLARSLADHRGVSALEKAEMAQDALPLAVASGDAELAEFLCNRLDACLDPLSADDAARNGDFEVLKWWRRKVYAPKTAYPKPRTFPESTTTSAAGAGHLEIVKWLFELREEDDVFPAEAIVAAAGGGHLDVLTWLNARVENGQSFSVRLARYGWRSPMERPAVPIAQEIGQYFMCAAEAAAGGGHLGIIRWLHENRPDDFCSNAMDLAAANGHQDVVEWLFENRREGFTSAALIKAAANGHLNILCILNQHRVSDCPCINNTIDEAAANGHLEIIQFLQNLDFCSTFAMDSAAQNGHFEIVRWLHLNRSKGCTSRAMNEAAACGHLEIVEYLHLHRNEGCSSRAMDQAAGANHLHVVKWLHANRSEGCSMQAFTLSALNGHTEMLLWLLRNCPHVCRDIPRIFRCAARSGYLELAKLLFAKDPVGCASARVTLMAEYGRLEVLQWMDSIQAGTWPSDTVERAAGAGHWEVVKWLLVNRSDSISHSIARCAVAEGSINVLEWLLGRFPEIFQPRLGDVAVDRGRLEVVRWVVEKIPAVDVENMRRLAISSSFWHIVEWLDACSDFAGDIGSRSE